MTTPLRQRADESLRVDVPDWTISHAGRAFAFAHPVGTHTGRENVLYSLEAAKRGSSYWSKFPMSARHQESRLYLRMTSIRAARSAV
jgi:hypothetical protein